MPLPVPSGLSPSKVDAFCSCPMAFRFSAIERIPEPPSPWTTKGTLVHRALELLHGEEPADRTLDVALAALDRAFLEVRDTDDYLLLGLDTDAQEAFLADAADLVERYFRIEDPTAVTVVGRELKLEARIGPTVLRGIIDRLDRRPDGSLVVVDYKTGKVPRENQEQGRLAGVHFYALLCENALGERPSAVQLLYLREPLAITATPTDSSIRFLPKKVAAVWSAIERACERDDFRPRTGPLCSLCSYKPWCPAFGGDPTRARAEALAAPGVASMPAGSMPVAPPAAPPIATP
jgi:putative RecB family exonuclease